MNKPVETPAEPQAEMPLQETTSMPVPVVVGGVEEYQSSEEIAMAHHSTFVNTQKEEEEKAQQRQLTEKQKVKRVLDKYIKKHSTVKAVRERLKENNKPVTGAALEVQFEVSDELVKILEKIKNEMR